MPFTELQNQTGDTLRSILQFPSIDTPIFYPVLLFVIFTVFTLATFFREVRRTGNGNFLSSLAVAGFVTTTIATLWSLIGLVQVSVVVITFVVSTVFLAIYIITK